MRNKVYILVCFMVLAIITTGYTQAPLGINYQGIARSADGSPIVSQAVGLRISITNGPNGAADYTEEHSVETNEFGLFAIVIGDGRSSGSLNEVDWVLGNKWLQVELDIQSEGNYILVGSQQLMSVPYALYAAQSGTDLVPGLGIGISNGQIYNTLPHEIQVLSLDGNSLDLSNSTSVDLSGYLDNTDSQNLSQSALGTNRTIEISGGTGATIDVADNDNDSTNEVQELTLTDNSLDLTNSTSVDLSGYLDNTDSQNLTDVLTQGADAGSLIITNLTNPIDDQDAATKSYVDTNTTSLAVDISANSTAISDETTARSNADAALQSELDGTQAGAGLGVDGTYLPDATTAYINSALDLKDADSKLDSQIEINTTAISANSTAISDETTSRSNADVALQSELDATQLGAGLDADGGYTPDASTAYINSATGLKDADSKLDSQIEINTTAISANSTAISDETTSRSNADVALQSELDATQLGAGLDADGGYTPDASTAYINSATGLKDADSKLDSEIAINKTDIATNAANISANASSISNVATNLANNYAFSVDYDYLNTGGAILNDPIDLSANAANFDAFGQIVGDQVQITEDGIYMFSVLGQSEAIVQLSLRVNGDNAQRHKVLKQDDRLDNTKYNDIGQFLLSLSNGDYVELIIESASLGNIVNGTLFGYKL